MQGKAIVAGLRKYLKHLVKLLVLPWLLWSLWNVAKRHQDVDSRAPAKFIAAVVIGLAIFGLAVVKSTTFHGEQIDGMYDNLDGRLSAITGNATYGEALRAPPSEDRTATLSENQEGQDFYIALHEFVVAQEDTEARALLATSDRFAESGLHAFDRKDEGVADFEQFMYIFVYPGLIGIFFAPIVFTAGRIINKSWVPSESVGFKPYPATSGSLFLLLGAFGIPAVLFAAWAFMDIEERSAEGQISL